MVEDRTIVQTATLTSTATATQTQTQTQTQTELETADATALSSCLSQVRFSIFSIYMTILFDNTLLLVQEFMADSIWQQ